MKIKKTQCKSAIGKCGFPGGGFAINPYIGCEHDCKYCYARFMKRFTKHNEEWGSFVDVKINISEMLEKQLKSLKYKKDVIFIGTVTDPYQPVEKEYKLMRKLLHLLKDYKVSILTKSDLVLRDIDLLKQIKDIDINFTINSLDSKWQKLVEPNSSTTNQRLSAAKKLVENKIKVFVMMGPYWPFFTDAEALFKKFKKIGVSKVFSESLNTIGGNYTNVEKILKKHYPDILQKMNKILFDKDEFNDFYNKAAVKIKQLSKKYKIPVTIYFGQGHAAKFKK